MTGSWVTYCSNYVEVIIDVLIICSIYNNTQIVLCHRQQFYKSKKDPLIRTEYGHLFRITMQTFSKFSSMIYFIMLPRIVENKDGLVI